MEIAARNERIILKTALCMGSVCSKATIDHEASNNRQYWNPDIHLPEWAARANFSLTFYFGMHWAKYHIQTKAHAHLV